VMSVDEVARHFNVSTKTVYDWIKRGIIPTPPKKIHGTRRTNTFTHAWLKSAQAAVDKKIQGGNDAS
jgi:excisionase family DNA binding protein